MFMIVGEVSLQPNRVMLRQSVQDRVARGVGAFFRWRLARTTGIFLLLESVFVWTSADTAYAGSAALLIDADSGAVHYAYRVDAPHPPASLTKMMTIYLAFEALRDGDLKPGQRLRVSRASARQTPSRLGLRRGRTIRTEDAILAMVTKSANDAAVVIAEALAGTESSFAQRMTARAKSLGMTGTVYRNASGLHHPEQTTTARDMARLASALIRDFPNQYHLFSKQSFVWRGRRYRNHNPMLASYDGADGVKTGYIRQSGYNLVASARRHGRRLIGVVLGSDSIEHREWMMATMLDYGFGHSAEGAASIDSPQLPYALDLSGNAAFEVVFRNHVPPNALPEEAAETPPADLQDDATKTHSMGEWSIQVGAYRSAPPANDAAMRAASRIPSLLGNARVLVTQTVKAGQRMFRARLIGLSEGEARKSCRQLAALGIPCLAVAATGEFRTDSLLR